MFIIRALENYAVRKSIAQSSPYETHDYAEMAIRTANKRAYLRGEGAKMQEWGISTVIINRRHGACGKCADFVGMVFIDDVYAGGKPSDHGGQYPLLSDAMKAGLFHPRCKDSSSLYIEGISTPPDREVLPKKAQEDLTEIERAEQRAAYGRRMEKMNKRLSKYALDPDNKKTYQGRAKQWSDYTEKWSDYHKKLLEKAEKSGIIKSNYYSGFSDPISKLKSWINSQISSAQHNLVSADYLSNLPRIGHAESVEDSLMYTNPSGDTANCQRCVPSFEMRQRGYDVVAKRAPSNPMDDTIGLYDWKNVFVGAEWKKCFGTGKEEIISFLQEVKGDARVEIAITTKNGSHLFVGYKSSDRIHFIDPQNGLLKADYYFDSAISDSTLFCRIDTLKISNLIKECIEVK